MMDKLNESLDGIVLQGTPWAIFRQISTATNYPLAFTEADLAEFVNYENMVELGGDNGISTYRDAVKTICQMMGCFAEDDRTGRLIVREFAETPCCTLTTAD